MSDWSDSDYDSDSDFSHTRRVPADCYEIEIATKTGTALTSVWKSNLQDFNALQHLVRRSFHASPGKLLCITWRDEDGKEIPIENDEDLQHSIDAQTAAKKSNLLNFHVIIKRKRTLPSLSSSSPETHDANRQVELVRYWCREGKEEHRSPLYSACEEGDLEGVKALLQCTLDMVAKKSKFVKKFIKKSIAERVNEALEDGDGSTPLHIAAWLGHMEIVSFLISQGADLEAVEENLWTPLHSAAYNGHKEIVSILLAAGANIMAEDSSFGTPLHFAAERGHAEITSLLITQKANVDHFNLRFWTPLHYSVEEGHCDIIRCLISHGANIEAVMVQDYNTPLHSAVNNRRADIVALLINAKADLTVENGFGLTALESAEDDEIANLLRNAMDSEGNENY